MKREDMTDHKEQLSYLLHKVEERIAVLKKSSSWYRTRHYTSTLSTVFLSGTITILAGLKTELSQYISNSILVLGTLSTFISAWGAFFSPKETWLLYTASIGRLRSLQARIEFESKSPLTAEELSLKISGWFEEYQRILDTQSRRWEEIRSTPQEASKKY